VGFLAGTSAAARAEVSVADPNYPRRPPPSFCVWILGSSDSGMAAIGGALTKLLERRGVEVELLDEANLRGAIGRDLGFGRADRQAFVQRAAILASRLGRNGISSVVAIAVPFRASLNLARWQLPRLLEVVVDAPFLPGKAMYAVGLDSAARSPPVDASEEAEQLPTSPAGSGISIDPSRETVDRSVTRLIGALADRGWLGGVREARRGGA
jgi:adenylylsulfate kinase-like enzyme